MKLTLKRILLAILFLSFSTLACLSSITDIFNPGSAEVSESENSVETISVDAIPTLSSASNTGVVTDLVSQQDALVSLYENVSAGVVSIQALTDLGGAQGTGFVIDHEGHIVTNFHVVQDAIEIQVVFTSGLIVRAEVIGTDADSDLAVVLVDVSAEELVPLALGDSSLMKVGQIVVAIGNPFGLASTMTTGIVSGLGRTGNSLNPADGGLFFAAGDMIQTDAAINPGNTVGPLLNLNGEVIGINRSITTFNVNSDDEPVNSGVGFAVSVNILKRVVPSLIANGLYEYPYLGVSSEPLYLEVIEGLNLGQTTGVWIRNVTVDAPADQAGLQINDVIIAFNDQEIRDFGELISFLFTKTAPGDTVLVTFIRNGEVMETELVIGARP
ncbi:MAG: trypsin-like peptidase domain-containing protein [Chloroflexota bacterium]